jgi:hypothetical protein
MTGLVYTAVIDGYEPRRKFIQEEGIDYQRFTDALPYSIMQQFENLNPRQIARTIKAITPLARPGYDWWLWLDGSMSIKARISGLIEELVDCSHDFAAFRHNEWGCTYREIEACIKRKKDSRENLTKAMKACQRAKLPHDFGAAATGVLWRRNTSVVKEHALEWLKLMQDTTWRDQCTFMLPLWLKKIYIEWIPGLHTKNMWFKYHRGHR